VRRGQQQIARVLPPPDAPRPADDEVPAEPFAGDRSSEPPARPLGAGFDEPRVPRGCHPLVFGVVMATIQFAITIYFMQTC
jgi:hypothetical protein